MRPASEQALLVREITRKLPKAITQAKRKTKLDPKKSEVNAALSSTKRFLFVSRGNPVFRPSAPIRRSMSTPFEAQIAHEMHKRPCRIVHVVSRQPQLPSPLQHPRNLMQGFNLDEAALVVSKFRPWVRKQDEDSTQACIRQSSQHIPGIIRNNTNIIQVSRFHLRQQLCNPICEGFATDKASTRILLSLCSQMLSPTKSHFKRKTGEARKCAGKIQASLWKGSLWQQITNEVLLLRA